MSSTRLSTPKSVNACAGMGGDAAGSPLFASGTISAYGVEAPSKLADPMIWALADGELIKARRTESTCSTSSRRHTETCRLRISATWPPASMTRSHLRANREGWLKFQLLLRRPNLRQTRGGSLLEFRSCALPAFWRVLDFARWRKKPRSTTRA